MAEALPKEPTTVFYVPTVKDLRQNYMDADGRMVAEFGWQLYRPATAEDITDEMVDVIAMKVWDASGPDLEDIDRRCVKDALAEALGLP